MDAPIATFRNFIISLVGVALIIHSFVLEHIFKWIEVDARLQTLSLEHPILSLLVTAVLTGTTLYSLVVVVPAAAYVHGGWKVRYPGLAVGGDWIAQITPTGQIPISSQVASAIDPPFLPFLTLVEIHQDLFRVGVTGFNSNRSRFSSIIADFDEGGVLRFIYQHERLQTDPAPELNEGTTIGIDALNVVGKRLGRPNELHGQWHMCALPNTRLFRGRSRYLRINKKEKIWLKRSLETNPNLTLRDFEQWRLTATESHSSKGIMET